MSSNVSANAISPGTESHPGSGALTALAAAMKRWCMAYIDWRMEHAAIIALRSMSDRELSDLGINRSEITNAVKGEAAVTPARMGDRSESRERAAALPAAR